ncbi:HD-GYP domain-containing protein [uncultured Methylibium sp.]|uniref:HD-GYP domain-containing protein n=1 Tax=uncultured Methylibium sp. TaxID=381093 RepID=UPI0025ED1C85|nr:HD-GYP domain-containing protein [uncultured Methylibium sp.]
MLKRIPVDQLRLGMHLHELCGAWVDHPFWRSKFVLRDSADLESIRASSIREAVIDVDLGLDVAPAAAPVAAVAVPPPAAPAAAERPRERTQARAQHLAHARKLVRQSHRQVLSMFNEVRMGRAADMDGGRRLVDEIAGSVMDSPGTLVSLVRLKSADQYTYLHSVAVCALMVSLGRQLGLAEDAVREAGLAGLMHDLGKAMMPMDVLNKPGKLTDAEFTVIKSHPKRGHELLVEGGNASAEVLDVCLHHHEKFDGSGSPERLSGDAISLVARMGAVCDVYDAVTSDRPYKAGWNPADALRQMAQWKGHFDPVVFQAFVKSIGIYPAGSLVRLASGRLAVVLEQNGGSLLAPRVKAFFSTKSNLRIVPEEIDLAAPRCSDKIVAVEPPEQWRFQDIDELWAGEAARP